MPQDAVTSAASTAVSGDDGEIVRRDAPWDIIVTGVHQDCDTGDVRTSLISSFAMAHRLITMTRQEHDVPNVFRLCMKTGHGVSKDVDRVDALNVSHVIAGWFDQKPGKVLIDITSTEIECLFYLLPAFYALDVSGIPSFFYRSSGR